MTGGIAVILGTIGANFGAGMTGGMASLRSCQSSGRHVEHGSLVTGPVAVQHWEDQLLGLSNDMSKNQFSKGAEILRNWDLERRILFKFARKKCWIKFPIH